VSESHPYKDYLDIQERYADCGVVELWVIDPELSGPARWGGPHLLQVWQRDARGRFARVVAGDAWRSPTLGAWVRVTPHGVVLSDDADGQSRWLTAEEAARAAATEAEARIRELEAELSRRGG
jgi:hypothetical protein